jgi:hypothetical protein
MCAGIAMSVGSCSGTPQVTPGNTGGASSGGNTANTGGSHAPLGGSSGHTGGSATATGGATPATGGAATATGGAVNCPTSLDYVGDSAWKHRLVVTAGAQYCGEQLEIRTLEQEFATKAKLTIAPGTYPLPETAGTYEFALPVCFDLGTRGVAPTFAGAGQLRTTRTTNPIVSYIDYTHQFNQPLTSADSSTWSFCRYISYWSMSGSEPAPDTLDGSVLFQWGDNGYNSGLQLCEGTSCDEWNDISFAACNPPFKLYRHTVTFQGGQVVLDVRIDGAVGVSAMPAAFVAAQGTLDGTAFAQTDYWKLVYSAPHHHFVRHFAVFFDAPISGACGLKVIDVDAYDRSLPEVDTIQCDLTNIAARTVTAATTQTP